MKYFHEKNMKNITGENRQLSEFLLRNSFTGSYLIIHKKANLLKEYLANLFQQPHLTRTCLSDPYPPAYTMCVKSAQPIFWKEEASKMILTFLA